MSNIPAPDEQTSYSSRRQDDLDALAWPAFSQHALDLLRSAGARNASDAARSSAALPPERGDTSSYVADAIGASRDSPINDPVGARDRPPRR